MNYLPQFYSLSNNIETLLLILFIVAGAIQLFYYGFFYARIFTFKQKKEEKKSFKEPISVIIAAHNEAENLRKFLPFVLEQDYPEFEVIVINDRSEDETETVIAEFQKKYKHFRSTFIKNNGKLKHGKKMAITLGVKAAKYDYVLLTDADCKPNSNKWIQETTNYFNASDIVLGYGPYFQEESFLNRIIRFDTMFIALQYMSFAKAGFPYMGIGRNLAYKKSLFVDNKGLASHAHIKSGDDDLFINEVANKRNVSLSCQENAFVHSIPENTYKFWIRQKQRHFSTFSRYKSKHQLLLAAEVFSRILFYVLFIGLMSLNLNNYYFWAIVAFRFLILFVVLWKAARFFQEKKLNIFLIIFDFVFPILNFFIYLESKITERKKW